MATKLDKTVTRETKLGDTEVLVALTDKKELAFKIKGKKKVIKLSLAELFKTAIEQDSPPSDTPKNNEEEKNYIINLHDFRSKVLISTEFDYDTKVKLERIIVGLLNKK